MPYMSSPTPTQLMPPPSSTTPLHIRTKNRRKLYLDAHPAYFLSPDLELADPLLYDKCIRQFQTPAEREADGKKKGYSGVLEADLWRSEAKVTALRDATSHADAGEEKEEASSLAYVTPPRDASGGFLFLSADEEREPKTKEEGLERWKYAMTLRFLRGEDADFDYKDVDESDEWDWVERREKEEEWFDDEEPDEVEGSGVQDF